MPKIPFDREIIDDIINEYGIDPGHGSIREVNRIVHLIENELGEKFIRMEFGIPGLPSNRIGVDAEIEALNRGVTNTYAPFDGIPELKEQAARFVKLFLDLDVTSEGCVPTIGAMQGCFVSQAVVGRIDPARRTILYLDPGFPVNKLQSKVLALDTDHIDFHENRGERLISTLSKRLEKRDVAGILWSSPNNPTWIVLTEEELRGIGELCTAHDVIAIEDMAYFGMDFRKDYSVPGKPPYQPTVAKYTDNYFILISSSKMFSYAGQRIALAVVSPALMRRKYPNLGKYFGTEILGHAFMHGGLYSMTAGVPETPQYGLLALLRAANEGKYDFLSEVQEYARRAVTMKEIFLSNGFRLVYDNDLGEPLADGFYFTISYPGLDGPELLRELIYYGISAISLGTTGSSRSEGIRACVSLTGMELMKELENRIARFHSDHRHLQ